MTKTLTPRVPADKTGEPTEPPVWIGPRVALAAGAAVALVAAVLAFTFKPAKMPATQQVAAAHYSVQMANYAFAPASITVNEGDTITWTNQDTAPHTVTTTSGPVQLNSPYLSKGQSWSYTFTAPGMYMYYCTVHPDMRAEVIVNAPTLATTSAPRTHAPVPATHAAAPAPVHASTVTQPTSPASSTSAAAAAAAAAATPPTSGPEPSTAPLQAQQAADGSGIKTLSPILLLSGLTAAIAVFCLLLVGSRAAPTAETAMTASHDPGDDDYDY